jgi:hypothetical protein
MADKHKIVFYGEIIEGQNLEAVKKNLGTLFKMDSDKIDRLLSKPSVLIKKDIDFPTASKYQEILKKAGAICKIEPILPELMIKEQKTAPVTPQPDENQGKYEVIFYGELVEGHDLTTVKKRLADFFNKDLSKIDEFLSHMPSIIKKNVDLDTALKYRKMLKKAGAICLIKPVRSMQRSNPVSAESEKITVSTLVSSSQSQTDNEPPSPKPIVNEQPSPESTVLEETRSELSNHLACPQCNFEQESSNKCIRCGFILQDCCKPVSQKLTAQGNELEKLSSEGNDQSTENQPNQQSDSFFKRLFHLTKEEGKEILRLVIGSAIIGAIVGFMWGGLYDPWQSKGFSAAWLNFLLFGGWGLAEVTGVVVARNLRHAKGRMRLIFNGALWGGIWVGLFTALELVKDVSSLESILFNTIIGLFTGFIIGGLISAICAINLSGIMTFHEEKTLTT